MEIFIYEPNYTNKNYQRQYGDSQYGCLLSVCLVITASSRQMQENFSH